jgi:ketosteroid isomerase-like protein
MSDRMKDRTESAVLVSAEDRLARLEAQEAIRNLVARYALAVDMRSLDALVSLYVEDVAVAAFGTGRVAMKRHFDKTLRRFKGSLHTIANQVVEFVEPDRAIGVIYGYSEHEFENGEWVRLALLYIDHYERRDGQWLFARQRTLRRWYACPSGEAPRSGNSVAWPGSAATPSVFQDNFPSYRDFWLSTSQPDEPVPVPTDEFLRSFLDLTDF